MFSRVMNRICLSGFLSAILLIANSRECSVGNLFPVLSGYDFLKTTSGATYNGIPLHGIPINGVWGVDTVVQRVQDVNAAGGTTNLHMETLQLGSNISVGGHFLFITIDPIQQLAWEVNHNHNLMTINATTFDATEFRAFFMVHLDNLGGQIVDRGNIDLSSVNNPWSNNAPPNAYLVNGVNHHLNGLNENSDFWPWPLPTDIGHTGPHPVQTAVLPEPSTLGLAAIGAIGLAFRWCRRRIAVL